MPFTLLDPFLKKALRIDPNAEARYFEIRKEVPALDSILYDMSAMNDKSSALLGHISLMIAVLSFFLSNQPGEIVKGLLLFEICMYVVVALLVLRCLDTMGPPFRVPPSESEALARFYYSEIELRRSLYARALRSVWALTALLVPILVVNFIWHP